MCQKIINCILFCLIFFIFLLKFPYKFIVIKGESMSPTYKNNQIVLAKKNIDYHKNDIIVFKLEDEVLIKRILYTGGETIYFYIKDEKIFLENSYTNVYKFKKNHNNIHLFSLTVPKDHYFVIGDNLKRSDDSRRFGWISKEDILYKVID